MFYDMISSDHQQFWVRLRMPRDIPLLTEREGMRFKTILEYLFFGSGWLTSYSTDVQLFCKSVTGKKLGIKWNDLQLVASPGTDELTPDDLRDKYNVDIPADIKPIDKDDPDFWSMLGLIFTLHPTSIGEIVLKNDDPVEYPLIIHEYLQSDYDRNSFIDGVLLMKDILTDKVFKDLGCELVEGDDEEYWSRENVLQRLLQVANTVYHPIGTCKMGDIDNDKMAVCDERLKVKGFENLRVIDASIMPCLTSGNTQAPCYMIGEKGADMIIQDHA